MKKSVVAFLLSSALVSPLAMAQVNLPEGLQEFGLQGSLDLADDDYSFVSNISYGYFIMMIGKWAVFLRLILLKIQKHSNLVSSLNIILLTIHNGYLMWEQQHNLQV